MQQEDYFPRGGVKRKATEPVKKIAKSENLFNVSGEKKLSSSRKRAPKIRKGDAVKEDGGFGTNLRLSSVDTLSYKKIQEGMLILGCVCKIKSVCLSVELPGRTYGLVMIKNISTPFSKELLKQLDGAKNDLTDLNKMFTPGQFVPTKVLSIVEDDKGTRVGLSVDPKDVNSALKHTQVKVGMLLWGAISEKHDHGYVVDLGIPNCRALLSNDNIDAYKQYEIGQTFYSVIVKCENAKHATTVTLSALEDVIENNTEGSDLSLDHVIPGMQVKYTINTIVKHGLEGTLLNDCTGYVNDLYLTHPLENLNKYREGQVVKARIMYVQPSTKFSYMMLRNLEVVEPPKLKLGASMNCQVRERISSGLIVKISTTEIGFVTYKRIIRGFTKSDGDFKQIINSKYTVGSQHHCVIIGYNHLEKMYICTFDMSLLKEGFFTKDNLVVGQEVNGVITAINKQGIVVKMGHIEGFVNNLHLSSGLYSDKVKGKFKVGQKVNARVWYIDDVSDNIQLTMKSEYLKDGRLLDETEKNTEFLGMVAKPTKAGVLVVFLGNRTAWLPNKQIPQLSGDDASNIFYKGQVIQCYVLNSIDDKVILTLKHKLKSEKTPLSLGVAVKSAKVTSVLKSGLALFSEEMGVSMFLPSSHLKISGIPVTDMYKEDDVVEDLVCISAMNKAVVSSTETHQHRTLSLADVKEDAILRCYFKKRVANGYILVTPIIDYPTLIVYNRLISAGSMDIPSPYQVLYCKVLKLNNARGKKKKFILASALLNDVYKYDRLTVRDHLDEHLQRLDAMRERLKGSGDALGNLEVGQIVNCVVNKVDKKRGCSVIIKPGQCNGIVELGHMNGKLNPKDRCKGVVIGINYEHKFALLSLQPNVINKINSKDELPEISSKTTYGQLLVVNKQFALALHTSGHLIYIPVEYHPNDFNPNTEYYTPLLHKKIKISHCEMTSSGHLIGFEKGMDKISSKMEKTAKLPSVIQKGKRKRSSVVQVDEEEMQDDIKEESGDEEEQMSSDENEKLCLNEEDSIDDDEEEEDGDVQLNNGEEVDDEDIKEEINDNEEEDDAESEDEEQEADSKEVEGGEESEEENDADFTLPGVDSFFQTTKDTDAVDDKSSDEDETEEQPAKKKKKLSNAERALALKEEEERLRKIEIELAESTTLPQSAEQFDRVLLGNPDDSEMWLRYIAFHTQSTELEKARAVIKRALEKISYAATQERLNVWLAYLNLENMYGTKVTFEKVFEEACRCNDTLTIYLAGIEMLAEMQKFSEMDEKIKKARSKFKEELKMWLDVAKVYYKCKRFADARKLKDIAITTISNKKIHIDLLVQFAILEFTEGEAVQGEALFETIIQTDPKRVDVWCTYVDQLIKADKIDIARSVLSRAAGQKLAYKKMRTLFKKYISFEREHGNEETLERATKLLKDYTN